MTGAPRPTPAGFGNCGQCAYRETGTPKICSECASQGFEALSDLRCDVCDLPLASKYDICGNPLCRYTRYFERNYSIAMRTGRLENAINRYKFRGGRGWSMVFARVLLGHLEEQRDVFSRFDLIVASPSFMGEGASRNYDHTRLVLEKSEEYAPGEWPFDLAEPAAIVKTADTGSMVKAPSRKDRQKVAEKLREVLEVPNPDRIEGRSVLVYDDIFTDGQTLNEVARALLSSGAERVCGITLARQPFTPKTPSAAL